MFETVTVDQAMARGHRMITVPAVLLLLGVGFGFYFFLSEYLPPWIWGPGAFFASILVSWIYWSIQIPKWRVWAFDNVRNVHELKKRAVQEKLIWDDGSVFNKTEIWTASDKEKWELLQDKFKKPDEVVYEEDPAVPSQTIVYYSRSKASLEALLMVACLVAGALLIIENESYFLGSVLCLIGGYTLFGEAKKLANRTPQIILSDEGIQTANTTFYHWKEIENEDVEVAGSGKYTSYYLVYLHPQGRERMQIDDLDISRKKLRKLLRVYKGRSRLRNNLS